jgi:hypothetical protein
METDGAEKVGSQISAGAAGPDLISGPAQPETFDVPTFLEPIPPNEGDTD